MAEVTVKPYQPNLVPVDYDPFVSDQQPTTFQPQAKLIAKDLFNLKPSDFNPALTPDPNSKGMLEDLKSGIQTFGKSFMEGFNKSGQAGLKSMGEALENQYIPEGAVKYDDAGKYYDKDGKELPVQRRPNLLPVTRASKEGEGWGGSNFEGAMPALADIWNTLGGPGGATLGAGPSLRPALKYMDKIYKAKAGEQHLDAIPKELQDVFQKQALSGEDISNFNFGFINHKGHFLQREDALKYAIDHGILDPNDAKYGALVTTMLNKSGGEGKLASTFFSALEDNLNKINQNKASGEQWLGTLSNAKGVKGEELEYTGLKEFLAGKKNVSKQEIEDYLKENKVELQEVWKGARQNEIEQWKVIKPNGLTDGTYATREQADARAFQVGGKVEAGPNMILDNTKYSKWQLPGATNYRELLMTLPNKVQLPEGYTVGPNNGKFSDRYPYIVYDKYGDFRAGGNTPQEAIKGIQDKELTSMARGDYSSSHWDEKNILAHMRMNDRTIDGKKSLHLEEIQSDWHQQGREKGYKVTADDVKAAQDKYAKAAAADPKDPKYIENRDRALDEFKKAMAAEKNGVPDAPFKKTWHELALKRAIREAAENGYERLSWTPGEAQAARYDLSKQLKELQYLKNDDGTYEIAGITSKGDGFNHPEKVTAAKLPDVVGKEMAEKIIKNEGKRNRGQPSNGGYFDGVDLKIGGEGMKGFYDNIIPKSVEKIAKEFGVKVKKGEVVADKEGWHITPPEETTSKKWMVKSSDYNSKGMHFETKAEAEKALAEKLKKSPIFYIDIPPAMRQSVMQKGQPLFSGTSLIPVSHIPEFEDDK